MASNIGSHLLGRNPSPPDDRNYRLSNFLKLGVEATSADPAELIALGVAELKLTTVKFARWAATDYSDVTKTHWWKALNYFEQAKAALNPVPTGKVEWENPQPTLDQGNTGHCVGFSGAQFGNTLPINDQFDNNDGHALYYECKVVEGEPNQENGAYVDSIGKVLLNRKRIGVYAFAASIDEAIEWVKTKGPVIFGTVWLTNMFDPDSSGLIKAIGSEEGGHAYVCLGYDPALDQLLFLNSWGSSWGVNGHFRMSRSDAIKLFSNYGEVLAAVELPL